MNILTVDKMTKSYGDRTLFDQVSFGINGGEKIGVIGVNGTGKTTLLRILSGMEYPDQGEVMKANGISIAFLPQNPEFDEDDSIIGYVLKGKASNSDEWSVESEAKTILTKLGITDFTQKIDHLSGGQKKRIALARTLVAPADVLILDEPTNHIDNEMAIWLEQYLNKFRGVLLMVTHDRYFLDRVTNKIIEIDNGKIFSYSENYSGFLEMKAQREEMEWATERKRQSILRVELEWMKRGARARSTKQKARIERFEDLSNSSGPKEEQSIEIESVGTRLGKKTVELKEISKAYGDKVLINSFTHIALRNERFGIIGPNGCGKSTLIKMITGLIEPDSGTIEIGDTIQFGYFAQENEWMDDNNRVIDYIRDVAEYIQTSKGQISASMMLERFLFSPEMQYTPIQKLSGGEKRRLYLLRVLMGAPNVLILDEPTNDLDIATLTILEDYLDAFNGIVITVSHDRYFLDRIVDRIFAFEGNGKIRQYEGGYTDYLDTVTQNNVTGSEQKAENSKNYVKPKDTRLKFTYKEKQEYERIDEEIATLEQAIEDNSSLMESYASQYTKLNELTEEKQALEQELEEKMDRWIYLNDLAEQIEKQ